MPIITSIKPQKTRKRVSVYLDGKFGFGIDLESLVRFKLRVEKELTEAEVKKIVKEAEFQKVYAKVLRFASLRPRSEKEFRQWLRKYKVHKSLYRELFRKLKRLDFLNDRKFSFWWVGQRMDFRPKSKRMLYYELKNKGIEKDIIDEVISELKIDEVQVALALVEKKKSRWEKMGGFEARKRISDFLARRGFGWDVIKEVVKKQLS
jgi:regulatory protein